MFFKGCFDSRVNMHLSPSDYVSNRVNVGFDMLKVTWNTIITECFLGKEHFVKTAFFKQSCLIVSISLWERLKVYF